MGLYSEGLLSEGYLHLRFGGLIFGRAFFFWGGGGGSLSEFYGIAILDSVFVINYLE